jgi:2-phosphoglycerate kinase
MKRPISAILITGTSHTGKTTLASRLADKLGWNLFSTDKLARHPGRPWPAVPPAVAEYYANLSSESIYWFLRVHHENMWPLIKERIEAETLTGTPFIFEGSALRPEYIAAFPDAAKVCLYAEADFLRDRIRKEAQYAEAGEHQRQLIDKFIERSLKDNALMREGAEAHEVMLVDAADTEAVNELFNTLIEKAVSSQQ